MTREQKRKAVRYISRLLAFQVQPLIYKWGTAELVRESYDDYIKGMCESNCVLEVMQKNGRGSTIRLAESIMCDRRLLTNNKEVKNHEAFDMGYIHQFEKASDIDIDFIKNHENIDYSSIKESFSPNRLLEFIYNYFNEQKNI